MFRLFKRKKKSLNAADSGLGWTRIFDFNTGAWQSHSAYEGGGGLLAHPTLFACISLISADVAKLKASVQRRAGNLWEDEDSGLTRLLAKPNGYQNHIRFKQHWLESKLVHGNSYVLKERNSQGVAALHVLDPRKVTPLVSDSGEVFYKLSPHKLANQAQEFTVPAREIIHDRWNCLYHPLVGLPPLYAAATASKVGQAIQQNSKSFFENGSNPSGILTAPGSISATTAENLKNYWEKSFNGTNNGRVAVAGDGLTYTSMRMNSVDAQTIEQLRWSAETVCSVFHVPGYMVGVGQQPTHNNIEALSAQYYTQCLQVLIEDMEAALDSGLRVGLNRRVQLNLDGLFRMDTASRIDSLARAVGSGILSPNEARELLNHGPVTGGETPYMQQQNYSLQALANRNAPE